MKLLSLLALSAGFLVSSAYAQFSTSFENPPYASGTINGQDSWSNQTATASAAQILTASEIQTLLEGRGLSTNNPVRSGNQAFVSSATNIGGSSSFRLISGLGSEPQVTLDVWSRPLTGGNQGNIFMTMEDGGGVRAAAFRFGTNSSIDFGTQVTTGLWTPSGITWDPDSWYNLTMTPDYTTKTYAFAINGVTVSNNIPFYAAGSTNFDRVRVFRGSNQGGAIFDDLSVVAVPEPATWAGLALGAGLIAASRRRRG